LPGDSTVDYIAVTAPAVVGRRTPRPAGAAGGDDTLARADIGAQALELDEIDKAIIRELQRDGRMPYAKLGPAVGLSQAAARQRVQRLVDRGVMQVVAVTDPLTLGFEIEAMLGIRVDGDLRAAAEEVGAIAEVDYVVITSGRFDILAEVVCTRHDALLSLVNDRIRAIPGVRAVEIFTYLELTKQTYAWGAR
jgi:Lrp/AsnC family transcriptional regulator for asnA, asnC and gidA